MKTAMTKPERTAMKPDGGARMKVKLKHNSGLPGSEGMPGDIVEVPAKLGKQWIEERAAEAADEPVTPAAERKGTPERNKIIEEANKPK